MKQVSALRGATPIQRRGMAMAIGTQCLGSLGVAFAGNGLLLLYLLALDFDEAIALALTSGLQLTNIMAIFFANWAEKRGLKWVGAMSLVLNAVGLALMGLVYLIPKDLRLLAMGVAIFVYSMGKPLFTGIWFPLLKGVIPEGLRGRFFGLLRFSWQLAALSFLMVCPFIIGDNGGAKIYALLLVGIVVAQVLRIFLFSRIPSPPLDPSQQDIDLWGAIRYSLHWPGLASFCAYVFLLTLATGMTHTTFALTEKMVLGLSDSVVVWLGNLGVFGSILGFLLGGMMIDRYGTKIIFLVGHFGAGILMFTFVARGGIPLPTLLTLGLCHGLAGFLLSAVGLAMTTEMFSLEPDRGKNVAYALMNSCMMIGSSLAGVLGAGAIKLGIFQEKWHLFGATMGAYDALLLLSAGAVMLLVVTLCLVPSVLKVKPHRVIPQA